jgi:hypothetical protein
VDLALYWLLGFFPQVFMGSLLGFRGKKTEFPCSVNLISRGIDELPFFLNVKFIGLLGGALPFVYGHGTNSGPSTSLPTMSSTASGWRKITRSFPSTFLSS